ncbi:MAG: FlgD immunoglobulin-like domain containing protein [Bacteroidota bacterium]
MLAALMVVVGMAGITPALAQLSTVYVSVNGNNANNGAQPDQQQAGVGPVASLANALTKVGANGTIVVQAGTYAAGGAVNFNQAVSLQVTQTTVNGAAVTVAVIPDAVTVNADVTISGGNGTFNWGGAVTLASNTLTLGAASILTISSNNVTINTGTIAGVAPVYTGTVNLLYQGGTTLTAGLEASTTQSLNVTVNGANTQVTLSKASINNVALSNSGTNSLTLPSTTEITGAVANGSTISIAGAVTLATQLSNPAGNQTHTLGTFNTGGMVTLDPVITTTNTGAIVDNTIDGLTGVLNNKLMIVEGIINQTGALTTKGFEQSDVAIYNLGVNTLTVMDGDFMIAKTQSAQFNGAQGTLAFTGTAADGMFDPLDQAFEIGNLTINKANRTITAAQDVTVNNNLTVTTNSTLNQGGKNFTVAGGAVSTVDVDGTISNGTTTFDLGTGAAGAFTLSGTGTLANITVEDPVTATENNSFSGTLDLKGAGINITGTALTPLTNAMVMRNLAAAASTALVGPFNTLANNINAFDLTYYGGTNNGANLAVSGANGVTGTEYAASGIRNLSSMEIAGAATTTGNATISGTVSIIDGFSFGNGNTATLTGDSQSHTIAGSLEDNATVLGDGVTITGSTVAGANNGDLAGVTVGTDPGANANTGSLTLTSIQRIEGPLEVKESSTASLGMQGDLTGDANNGEITGGIIVGAIAATANSTTALTLTTNAATNGNVTVNNGAVNFGAWNLTLLDALAMFTGVNQVNNANTFSFTASTGALIFGQTGTLDVKGATLPNLTNNGALTLATAVTISGLYDANANLTGANNVSLTLSGNADFADTFVGTFVGTGAFVTTGTTLTVSGNNAAGVMATLTDLTVNSATTTSIATSNADANNNAGTLTVTDFTHTMGGFAQDANSQVIITDNFNYAAGTYTSAGGFFTFGNGAAAPGFALTGTPAAAKTVTIPVVRVDVGGGNNLVVGNGETLAIGTTAEFQTGVLQANQGAVTIADNANIRVETQQPLQTAGANPAGTVTVGNNTNVTYDLPGAAVAITPGLELMTSVNSLTLVGNDNLQIGGTTSITANTFTVGTGGSITFNAAANGGTAIVNAGGTVNVSSPNAFPTRAITAPDYTLAISDGAPAPEVALPDFAYVGTPTTVQVNTNAQLQLPADNVAPTGGMWSFNQLTTGGSGNVDINGRGINIAGNTTFGGSNPFTNSRAASTLSFTGAAQTVALGGSLGTAAGGIFAGVFNQLGIPSGANVTFSGGNLILADQVLDQNNTIAPIPGGTPNGTVPPAVGPPNGQDVITNLLINGVMQITGNNYVWLGHSYLQNRNDGQHGNFIQGYQGSGVIVGKVRKALDLVPGTNEEFANVAFPTGTATSDDRTFRMFFPNADDLGTPAPQTDLILEVEHLAFPTVAARGAVGVPPTSLNYWNVRTLSGTLSPTENYDISVVEGGLNVQNDIADATLSRRFSGSTANPWGTAGTMGVDYTNSVDGNDVLTVTVRGAASAINAQGVLFGINLPNQRPVLTTYTSTIAGAAGPAGAAASPLAFTINEGEELDVSFVATVGSSFSSTEVDATDNAELTPDGFKFTPDFTQSGTYAFVLTAASTADASLVSDPITVNVTVNNANQPPAFTDAATTGTATDETPFVFDFNAADADGDALTFSLDAASAAIANASIDASTGEFSFAPSFAQAEDAQFRAGQDFVVIVSDGNAQVQTTVNVTTTRSRGLCDVDGDGADAEGKACDAVDASLVLQSVAGGITLSAPQVYAADVTGAAGVTAFDAAQILRYIVAFDPATMTAPAEFFGAGAPGAAKLDATGTIAWGEATTAEDGSILLPLTLTGNVSNVYAVQVEAEVDLTMGTLNGVDANLPDDWMVQHQVNEDAGTVTIVMAGTTPLTTGEVATLGFGLNNESAVLSVKGSGFLNEGLVADLADAEVRQVPTDFALDQNYPNPFNPTTLISYSLPQASAVTLQVFDINGRLVQTLVNGSQEAGRYKVEWNGRNMSGAQVASGLYIYRVQADNFSAVKRMMLVK